MSRRRTARRSTAFDASFQIPLAINSTSNDLLLEDESLEHEFFDGFEYTLTTPVSSRTSSSNITTPSSKSKRAALQFTQSDRENYDYDYDYAQEEREMANTDVEEETPRARITQHSSLLGLTPTPRSRPNRPSSSSSILASRLPTLVSTAPVRHEAPIAIDRVNDNQSSPAKQPRSSASPSITPKPKHRRGRTSQATPLGHSARSGATVPSPSPQQLCRKQLQLRPEEAETNMSCRRHASSSPSHAPLLSESALREQSQLNRFLLTSVNESTRSSISPERASDNGSIYSAAQRPNVSRRRRSRSNARSSSPSGLSRIAYDAVMLPILEEDEDLEARDDQPAISKPQQNSDFPPNEKVSHMPPNQSSLVAHKNKKPRLSSDTASSKSKAMPSRNSSVKRSGDSLAIQPVSKKRKTEVNLINDDVSSGYSRTTPPYSSPSVPTSTTLRPEQAHEVDPNAKVPSPSRKPVPPDADHRDPLSPISQLLNELRSEKPSETSNLDHAPLDDNHGGDDVHAFLMHIAKKYGSGNGASSAVSGVSEGHVSADSDEHYGKARVSAVSQQSSALPEVPAPKGKQMQFRVEQPPTSTAGKYNASLKPKTVFKRVSIGRNGQKKRHSASGQKGAHGNNANNAVNRIEATTSDLQTELRALRAMMPDTDSQVLHSPRESSTSELLSGKESARESMTRQAGVSRTDAMEVSSWDLSQEEPQQNIPPQTVEPTLSISLDPDERVQPECQREESESSTPREIAGPAVTVERATGIVLSSNHRAVNGQPPKRPPTLSAQPAPKATRDPQTRSDDMFTRKKRDNYLQRGLDLTPYSSRRFAAKAPPPRKTRNAVPKAPSQRLPKGTGRERSVVLNESSDVPVVAPSRSVKTVLDLTSDAEDQTLQHAAQPNADSIDPSGGGPGVALTSPEASRSRSEQFGKSGTEKLSDRASKEKASSHDSGVVTPKQSRADPNNQGDNSTTSLTGKLLHVGQKIVGLLSSQNGEKREALHVSNVDCGHEAMEAIRGSGLDEAYHASNTTNQTQYTQHFPEAAKPNDAESNGHVYPSGADSKAQALRHSQKRSLSSDSQNIEANDLHYTGEGAQVRKKVRLSREDAVAAGLEVPSKPYRSDKPRNIIPGRGDRIKGEATRGLLGNKKAKPANTCAAPHGAGTNSSRKTANGSSGVGPAKTSCTLTVPVAPAFTTDVLHHKRIHVRSEREARQQAISVGVRTNRLQSDDRSAGNCAKVKVITSDTQTREPWKPTVPHAFRFETDTRLANRRQEFEAKLKLWEQRATGSRNSNEQVGLTNKATRRRNQIAPTIPVSPQFALDTRLAQRHKFDDAQRAKEKEAERIKEEQRRAREEEEEREWREARKRAVPRANQIPEWYSKAPRRTATNR